MKAFPNQGLSSRIQAGGRAASLAVILIGGFELVRWIFLASQSQASTPTVPALVPNSALGFILLGLAAWLLHGSQPNRLRTRFAQLGGLLVGCVGATTICEHLFGWSMGVDLMILSEVVRSAQSVLPGRLALFTAANFAMIGAAIFLLGFNGRTRRRLAEFLTVAAVLVSLLALIGHVCGVPPFYGWSTISSHPGMPMLAVVSFCLLGSAVLSVRPKGGLMELMLSPTSAGVVARRLMLAPVLIPLAVGVLRQLLQNRGIYNAEVAVWLVAFLNILIFTLVIWWSSRLIHDADGIRQRAETELQQLNIQLEHRVNARTVELSRTLQALKESEERIRLVVDTALDAVITADDQGRITNWNREAERIFGWSAREIIGQRLADTIVPPSHREAHQRGMQHFLATSEGPLLNKRIEVMALRRDGRPFPVELAITPIQVGGTFLFSAFVRDITERKQTETRAAWLGSFPERNPNPIVEVDWSRGAVDYVNPFAARLFPDLREKGLQHPFIAGIDDAVRDLAEGRAPAVRRELMLDGACYAQTINYIVETSRVRVYSTDISDRKKAEAGLRESEERFRTMADQAPVMIWMSGPDKQFVWLNKVWLAFVGRPMEAELGAGWMGNLPSEDAQHCQHAYHSAFDSRQPFMIEYRMKRHDGELRWIENHGVPRLGADGLFAGYIGSCIDISERKRAADEVGRLNTELEERVRQRTAQLVAANRELEAFSYSVSHDLRAPLRHVAGYLDLLRENLGDGLNETGRRYIHIVGEASRQMGTLIDDLLTFSQMGRAEMRYESVDMGGLVRETMDEIRQQAGGRNIRWQLGSLPAVPGDRALLKQVWLNLLSNAVKYTRHREAAEILIDSRVLPVEIEYRVRDNGAGFDMTYVDKLFGVFQRLHRADEFEGTGIGLANVRRIVDRHGGRTWAEGALGAGATFYFTLPTATRPKVGTAFDK